MRPIREMRHLTDNKAASVPALALNLGAAHASDAAFHTPLPSRTLLPAALRKAKVAAPLSIDATLNGSALAFRFTPAHSARVPSFWRAHEPRVQHSICHEESCLLRDPGAALARQRANDASSDRKSELQQARTKTVSLVRSGCPRIGRLIALQ